MTTTSEWEAIANNLSEKNGDLSAPIINEREKSQWEQIASQYDKDQVNQKVKKGEPLSFQDMSWGRTIVTGLKNLPADIPTEIVKQAEGIYQAITNPIITGKAINSLISGAIKNYQYNKLGQKFTENIDEDKDVSAFLQLESEMYKRYGTEHGWKQAIAKNPAGVLMEMAQFFVPILKGTSAASSVAGLSKIAKVTDAASKVAAMADPLNLASKGINLSVKGPAAIVMNTALKNAPNNVMVRAMRLSSELPDEVQRRIIDITVKNNIPIAMKGYEKVSDTIEDINKFIGDLAHSNKDNGFLPHTNLLKALDEVEKKHLAIGSTHNISEEIDKVRKIINDNYKNALKQGIDTTFRNVEEAHIMKKKFNKELADSYQKLLTKITDTPITKDAWMAVNKTAREFVQTMIPETALIDMPKITNETVKKVFPGVKKLSVQQLNRLEGDMIAIREAMSDAVQKHAKGAYFDFKSTAKAATFTTGGHFLQKMINSTSNVIPSVGFGIGALIGVIDASPMLKSKLAIYLNNLKSIGITVRPTAAMIRLGLYTAGDYAKSSGAIDEAPEE